MVRSSQPGLLQPPAASCTALHPVSVFNKCLFVRHLMGFENSEQCAQAYKKQHGHGVLDPKF